MLNKKKGQVTYMEYGIIGVLVLFIMVGMIISVGQKTISVAKTTMAVDQTTNITNKTFTFANNSALDLGQSRIASVTVYGNNGSNNKVLNAGRNYTTGDGSVTLFNETAADPNDVMFIQGNVNISFTYNYGSQDRNITEKTQLGLESISKFQPTIGTILAIGVIISMLVVVIIMVYKKMY